MKKALWKALAAVTAKKKTNYTESELILPALRLLAGRTTPVTTSDLIAQLEADLRPKGHDAELIQGRNDTYFSQKVRNLKSHDSLKRLRLAKHHAGKWQITESGRDFLANSTLHVESMLNQGFRPRCLSRRDQFDYSKLVIEEGASIPTLGQARKRSDRLKAIAISSFKRDNKGRVFCTVCDFDFARKYGSHGRGFIEVHHLDPIFEKDVRGEKVQLLKALTRVTLVCSNCHRMIHRRKGHMLGITALKKLVLAHKCKS